jgi:hypothetical protein
MPITVALDEIAPDLHPLGGEAGHLLVQQPRQQLSDKSFILDRNVDRELVAPTRMFGVEKRRVADTAGTFGFGLAPQFEEVSNQLPAQIRSLML